MDRGVQQQRLVNRALTFSQLTQPDRRRNSRVLILGGLHFLSVTMIDWDVNEELGEK